MKIILKLYLKGLVLCGVFFLGTLVPFVSNWLEQYLKEATHNYDPKKPEDLAQMRRLGYQATPLLEAIRDFQAEHGAAPEFAQLENSPRLTAAYRETCLGDKMGWTYIRDDAGHFRLSLKLNWDASLRYDSKSHVWQYNPGDGRVQTTIEM